MMATTNSAIPIPPTETEKDSPQKKDDNIEKIPKHTHPGSKYALKNEDFADEASYQTFANEPQRDKNPTWPK